MGKLLSPAMRQVMGLRPALKLCNRILHRHPLVSPPSPIDLRRNPAEVGGLSPSHAQQRGVLFPQARAGGGVPGAASPPPRNLRGAEPAGSGRRRLCATTHSALPLEHGKSRGGGRRGAPNLPARGLSLTRQRVPLVRARRANCSQTPALPRRWMRTVPLRRRSGRCPTPGAGFSRGK